MTSPWLALTAVLVIAALLRLPLLDRVPNGFFLDEASRGYDALSLIRTGADQYGVRWPLFAEGLDDYTPTLFTLLVIPSVATLGLNETAVRLPAPLVGIATVVTTFLAGRVLLGSAAGLVGAALVAISPWHILPSRTGAEWVLLPLFTTLGVWLLLRGRTHGPSLLLAGLTLGIGLYSYAFARLLIPLLVVGFVALSWRELVRHWRWALAAAVLLLILAAPLFQFGFTSAGQARLQAVIPLDRYKGLALVPYAIGNFVSYFGPAFLIWGREPTDHHRLDGFGPILPLMVPLVAFGLLVAIRRPARSWLFVLWWIVAAPASAALHRESPSSALLLGAIPAWQLLAGFGAVGLVQWAAGWRRQLGTVVGVLLVVGIVGTGVAVGRELYVEYPVYAAEDWLYGSREAIAYLEARRGQYDDVLVSDRLPTPHILLLFYGPVDPSRYQHDPIHVRQPAVRSQGQIGPYQFGRIAELLRQPGRHLVWIGAGEDRSALGDSTPLLIVRLPDGRPTQLVYEVERP